MRKGFVATSLALAAAGIVATIAIRSTWWSASIGAPPVDISGIGKVALNGEQFSRSAAAQYPLLSIAGALIVCAGIVCLLAKQRVRAVMLALSSVASLYLIAASVRAWTYGVSIPTSEGNMPVALAHGNAILTVVAAALALAASLALMVRYRSVPRVGMPSGAPQSLDEPDKGVWE